MKASVYPACTRPWALSLALEQHSSPPYNLSTQEVEVKDLELMAWLCSKVRPSSQTKPWAGKAAQLVQGTEPGIVPPAPHKTGTNMQPALGGGGRRSDTHGHPRLCSGFEDSVGPWSQTANKTTIKKTS